MHVPAHIQALDNRVEVARAVAIDAGWQVAEMQPAKPEFDFNE
jgi:hypothetical protein